MRLALVINTYPPRLGGLENHVAALAQGLRDLGHEVWVLTLSDAPDLRDDDGVRVLTGRGYLPIAEVISFPRVGTTRRIARFLREKRIDIVGTHTRFFPMSLVGLRAAHMVGIPVIHTEHGSGFVANPSPIIFAGSRAVDLTMGRYVLRHADRLLAISAQSAAFVKRLGGVDAEVFHNAIPAPEPSPSAPERPGHLVFVGRVVAGKGWDAFLASVAALRERGIDVDGERHGVVSSASGTVITAPGFRLAYQEGRDQGRYDAEKADSDSEKTLPDVAEGEAASLTRATPDGHETQPPGRYTEATLVKTMEELGIGRPSTYAATIQTIGDRGYVTHRGQYLVPTWLAFSVTRLLEENLANLVDYDFTASMEGDLDRIAAGEENGAEFLSGFFFGPDSSGETGGLRHDVASLGDDIDARAVNSIDLGRGVTLRVGRYGPYLEKADGARANVPPEVAPDELDDQLVDQLFARAADDGRELGVDPDSGHTIIVKDGRYGPYVTEVIPEPEGDVGAKAKKNAAKPRTASLFKTMDISTVTLADALQLLSLPREVGVDPATGEAITAQNGRYGPYLKKGTDSRTLASEDQLLTITLDEALAIYAQPKTRGRGTARPPLREFGEDPISGKKVTVKDGRFGPYVTDGETNVTVPRAETVEDLTAERAYELLADKRAKGPAPKRTRKTAAKKTAAKKTATKKTAAKKTTAKKATAKKAAPKEKAPGTGAGGE